MGTQDQDGKDQDGTRASSGSELSENHVTPPNDSPDEGIGRPEESTVGQKADSVGQAPDADLVEEIASSPPQPAAPSHVKETDRLEDSSGKPVQEMSSGSSQSLSESHSPSESKGGQGPHRPTPVMRPNVGRKKESAKKSGKKGASERRGPRGAGGLTPFGFALRFMAAIALVFGSYNPSGHSYYHWVASLESADLPAKILTGLLVLAGWVVFFRATSRSLGPVGAILAGSVCGVALWWLIDLNVVAQSADAITYAVLFIVSVILTLGLTGSFVWRRLTGQYQVDADDGGMDD